jgi:PAS domain S-box-containing protein
MKPLRWLRILEPVVILAVMVAGAAFYRVQEREFRRGLEAQLSAIARLKAQQVAAWRRERLDEGEDLMERPLLAERLASWARGRHSQLAKQLLAEFQVLRDHDAWRRVHFVDSEGHTLLGLSPAAPMHEPTRRLLREALRLRRPALVDLHSDQSDRQPHINLIVPISDPFHSASPVAGAMVLTAWASDELFPLIQQWPIPTRTGEIVLVRREGDQVVFLNSTRSRPDGALNLRLPMSRTDLPAVKAVSGITGVVEGFDYRGIAVVAALTPVPDSPWFLVAKIDRAEALAGWRTISALILAFIGGLVAFVIAFGFMLRQRLQRAHFRDLYESESRRLAAERRFRTILHSIGDAVIAADARGVVEGLNPAAELLTGWTLETAAGKQVEEILPLLDEQTRQPVPSPAARVLGGETAVDLGEEILLRSRDGSEHLISATATPIRADTGAVTGAVLVLRNRDAERAAREAARFAYTMLDNSQDPICCLDPEDSFRLVYANKAACRHFGYPREELLKMTPADLDPKETPERLRELWNSRAGQPFRFETVHRTAAGALVPVEIVEGAIRHGGKTLWLRAIRDLTERKAAAAALRESEHRYRRLAEEAPDLVYRYELLPSRRFSYVSPSAARIVGYTPEEHYADPDLGLKVIHPEDRPRLEEILRNPEAAGNPFTLRWIRKDGRIIHVEQKSVLVRDDRDQVVAIEGIARDVTERWEVEESLRRSEARYRQLFLAHPLPMWVYDLETLRFLAVNDAAIQLYGYSREEFLSMTIRDIRPPEDLARLEKTVAQLRGHPGYLQSRGWRHRTREGRVFEVEIWSHPITFGDRESRLIAVIDVSERNRLEALFLQAQKMESVGRLAGGVAHDFNNMLAVILGNVEIALEAAPPPEIHSILEEIQAAARRSAELTRRLLAFARRQTVSPKVLDLNQTVEGMLRMLRRLIGEDIDLVWLPGSDLWPVFIDPAQVDQILANLCVNARDAISDTGKVTIETENRLLDEAYCAANPGFVPGAYVQLSVSDDGCGMTQETLSHLFEPFFTTKRPGEGTGLGLSTVYGIVRQNEGFVNVYSEPGKGTTVKIYLPRHTGAEAKGVEEEAAPAKAQGELVLLVEDEAAMLKVSRRLLENLGYRVLTADSPAEAIRLAEKTPEPVDVLITDVVMPEMNGRELAQRVQALHRNIRCLFMSGYTANVIARQGVLQPGVHFLQKPFNRAQLAAKLREVLGRGTTREE